MQRRADAAQAQATKAAATQAQATKATTAHPISPPVTTAAQQAARRGQQSSNKFAYIAAIEPILKDILKSQNGKVSTNLFETMRNNLVRRDDRLPAEQLKTMTKDQLIKLITNSPRPLRGKAGGGTRKNVTSSSHMTRRLLRQ
jgi:hypothetical protein